jgi:hypothetical protein
MEADLALDTLVLEQEFSSGWMKSTFSHKYDDQWNDATHKPTSSLYNNVNNLGFLIARCLVIKT